MKHVNYVNQYLLLVSDLVGWLAEEGVPLYSSEFSRKDFTLHQHIVLLVLRSRERKTYRDFVGWLSVSDVLCLVLGIGRVPHYTCLQKAADRLPPGLLEEVLDYVGRLIVRGDCVRGIDSTGFSLEFSSRHYSMRIKRLDKHRSFLKATIAADMKTQAILSSRLRFKRRHDSIDLKPVRKRACREVTVSAVVGRQRLRQRRKHAVHRRRTACEACYFPEKQGKTFEQDQRQTKTETQEEISQAAIPSKKQDRNSNQRSQEKIRGRNTKQENTAQRKTNATSN